MKKVFSLCVKLLALVAFAGHPGPAGAAEPAKKSDVASAMKDIRWFGQASVRIQAGNKVIYIDPLYFDKTEKADIILITHLHSDHYVYKNVAALMKSSTVVIAPTDLGIKNRIMKPGEGATVEGIKIEAVASYNIVKSSNHPKSALNNGYVVTVGGVRIYHAGDTELIPEMKTFTCDIALVPLGQTYTFVKLDDAVQAVLDVKAQAAIPIHWGLYEGAKKDALYFAEKLTAKGVSVEVREKEF